MTSPKDNVALRVRTRFPDAQSASEASAELEMKGVWIDEEGAASFDPGIIGFIIQNVVALAGPFVAWLALRANEQRTSLPVEDEGHREIIVVRPGLTDKEIDELAKRLSEHGRTGGTERNDSTA